MKIELEITSDCNAACPGCARTLNSDLLQINSFTLQDLQRIFPSKDIKNNQFKFCGVLGDPIVNPDCLKMIEWLVYNGGYCEISTNGGYNNADWWSRLGQVASAYPGMLHIHFCADGHKETNHIYRVNTVWKVLERNIAAYTDAGGVGTWIFIVFDHNEHEVEEARQLAQQLGFRFATRTGMRNSYHDWTAKIGKKNAQVEKKITTTGAKEHSKVKIVKELDRFIESEVKDIQETKEIISSIDCKYYHGDEIFVAANSTLWPCCFLWDSAFKNKESILDKYSVFPKDWNNLRVHSIEEILSSDYYQQVLRDSWDPAHNLHISRCIRTCAKNRAYHNEINYA